MRIGFFTDKSHSPEPEEIRGILGSCLPVWEELLTHIRQTYHPVEDFKFLYGKNYGWAVRFRLKGKLLTSLYPAEGYFSAQIIMSPVEVDTVQSMNMGRNVRQAIDSATPYPEGRWLFIPVQNRDDLADITRLLEIHARSKRA
ncbi:MAG: DUF3788 domain-containing protein [Chloroflexi bacterium]|jgi:hypothetical protein|nr:DUF3788 domain-containing protein [Chloroflexota bacterium]BCY17407.1 hypothetical protein hrd7_12560 [Leptolinea sp. HRD-7]